MYLLCKGVGGEGTFKWCVIECTDSHLLLLPLEFLSFTVLSQNKNIQSLFDLLDRNFLLNRKPILFIYLFFFLLGSFLKLWIFKNDLFVFQQNNKQF